MTITTSLPDTLVIQLSEYAERMNTPKNKFIEKALRLYLDHLKKAEYARSYKMAGEDQDIMMVAEEDMATYLNQIIDTELK